MNYKNLLEHSYELMKSWRDCDTRLEYLCEFIFDVTTYDSTQSEIIGSKVIEVCRAITDADTFEYIKDPSNYTWFLVLCNLPFFAERIEWGMSIRGSWWKQDQPPLDSCGLWVGDDQLEGLTWFGHADWIGFVEAVIAFSEVDKI